METPGPIGEAAMPTVQADGDAVALPPGFSYANAEFYESGADLFVAGPGGENLLIQGYFDGAIPPDLVNAEGGQIAGQMVARLARPITERDEIAQTDSSDAIGHVELSTGQVVAIREDGSRVELSAGDPVYGGDVLESGAAGGAGIVLVDGSVFAMGPGTRMVLDEVIYDAASGGGRIAVSLTSGELVAVCGAITRNDPDAMTVRTPMAEIAVRDAQAGISVPPGGAERIIVMELADGFVGEVAVKTSAGVEHLHLPNQGTFVLDANAPPTPPEVFVLDEVIAAYSSALSLLPADVGGGNDFGLRDNGGGYELGEEPAIEESETESEAELADGTPAGDLGEFESAAGGDVDGGVPDFIAVAGGGSSLTGIDPVGTQSGEFSVPASSSPINAGENEPPPPTPSGANVIQGDGGPNVLVGTAGADSIQGGAGNDTIDGRAGNDTLEGGAGNDLLRGGLGDDRIFGGGGDDEIVFSPGDGSDTVFDFGLGDDSLLFEGISDADLVEFDTSGEDLIITVKNAAGDETNQVTVKDTSSYSVTETPDGVAVTVDDGGG